MKIEVRPTWAKHELEAAHRRAAKKWVPHTHFIANSLPAAALKISIAAENRLREEWEKKHV